MPRHAVHTDDIKIEQKAPIVGDDIDDHDGDIVIAQKVSKKEYIAELAFNEEPVKIRLEPSAEKNAATAIPIWVNGKGCEVWMNGRWCEMAYLPTGQVWTIKRKYLAVLVGAKLDTIHTKIVNPTSERPDNVTERFTTAVCSFSVIEDKNPLGVAWLQELRRRNF